MSVHETGLSHFPETLPFSPERYETIENEDLRNFMMPLGEFISEKGVSFPQRDRVTVGNLIAAFGNFDMFDGRKIVYAALEQKIVTFPLDTRKKPIKLIDEASFEGLVALSWEVEQRERFPTLLPDWRDAAQNTIRALGEDHVIASRLLRAEVGGRSIVSQTVWVQQVEETNEHVVAGEHYKPDATSQTPEGVNGVHDAFDTLSQAGESLFLNGSLYNDRKDLEDDETNSDKTSMQVPIVLSEYDESENDTSFRLPKLTDADKHVLKEWDKRELTRAKRYIAGNSRFDMVSAGDIPIIVQELVAAIAAYGHGESFKPGEDYRTGYIRQGLTITELLFTPREDGNEVKNLLEAYNGLVKALEQAQNRE